MRPAKPGTYWIKYRDPYLDGMQGQKEVEVCIGAFGNNEEYGVSDTVDDWVMFLGDEVPGSAEHVLEIGPEILPPAEWD